MNVSSHQVIRSCCWSERRSSRERLFPDSFCTRYALARLYTHALRYSCIHFVLIGLAFITILRLEYKCKYIYEPSQIDSKHPLSTTTDGNRQVPALVSTVCITAIVHMIGFQGFSYLRRTCTSANGEFVFILNPEHTETPAHTTTKSRGTRCFSALMSALDECHDVAACFLDRLDLCKPKLLAQLLHCLVHLLWSIFSPLWSRFQVY